MAEIASQHEQRGAVTGEVLRHFVRLHEHAEQVGYTGYEFDDFLGSPICRFFSFGNLFLKRVFVQIGKYLPVNIRRLIGVKKLPSTKAHAFFARGYLDAYRATRDEAWLDKASELLDWLLYNASPGYSGLAWGNAFDFASRGGFFPKGLPTVVWTSHISRAFWSAYQLTQRAQYVEAVLSSGEFVLNDLDRREDSHGLCIAYAPGRMNLVHNSNLLGAVALLRAWAVDKHDAKYDVATRAFQWTLHHMNDDGSFYYGVGEQYRWIDGFHTAYIIDCLIEGNRISGESLAPFNLIERSFAYWRERFFLDDGTPAYYHDGVYPLDIQCAAQAIESFANYSEIDSTALSDSLRVFRWTVHNMRRRDGGFVFQKHKYYTNSLASIHWGQSTMLAAIGALLWHCTRQTLAPPGLL